MQNGSVHGNRVLVTGASGFIGGWIAEALFLGGSSDVRAGVRRWTGAARIARFPLEIVPCDIMDKAQTAEAMAGVTAVVHCAYNGAREVIVEGTRNLLEAALRGGVSRFVYLSTAEVYGGAQGVIDETHPCGEAKSAYARAKLEAEGVCRAFGARGLPVTILRPSIVYGPFGGSWTVDLAKRLQSGRWGTFAAAEHGLCNLVYVGDLVTATRLALHHEGAVGEVFNVNGPDKLTWNAYFSAFNDALGLPPLASVSARRSRMDTALKDRVRAVSSALLARYGDPLMRLYMEVGAARRVMKWTKEALFTSPSGAELDGLYSRNAYYTAAKAQRVLGYTPQVELARGLRYSVLWLEHQGYLKRPDQPGALPNLPPASPPVFKRESA